MRGRFRVEIVLLASIVAITRFGFRSHYLYDLDSVNFALGVGHFDPRVYQPHPPGYFLYICLGRLADMLFRDANLSLVVLSVLASCGAAVMIYLLALDWFGRSAARFAGALFVFSPLAWFHGTVALTYIIEAFFSALLGFFCWRVYCGRERFLAPAAFLLAICAGIRPSSLLFLGPLFVFSLQTMSTRRRVAATAIFLVTLVAWFLPMIFAAGGFSLYFGALLSLWRLVPSKGTVFNSSPATSIARMFTILFIYLLSFGAASVAPLAARYCAVESDFRKKVFTAAWIAPGLCFFIFIFLKFVNSGYLLLLLPAACVWLGAWLAGWYSRAAWPRRWKQATIAACTAANVLIFLFSPLYCSYISVRRFEAQMRDIQIALRQIAPAGDMLIIGFDSHFLGYRHAGYYLPAYVAVQYPEVKLGEGVRVFVMHQRETRLLAKIPLGGYSRFVLFPLPTESGQYAKYLTNVTSKLPRQDLRIIHGAGRDFITGPISDLPLLFPNAASGVQGVYAPSHRVAPPVNSRAHPAG